MQNCAKMSIFAKIFVLSTYVALVIGNTKTESYLALLRTGLEKWWGPVGGESNVTTEIRNFSIVFEEEMVSDLKNRINNRRNVTPPLNGTGFEYGFNTNILDSWMDYWANNYSFSEREQELNKFPQYKINVQGLDIHFIWVKPEVTSDLEVVPLLMLHGWPGSCREFYGAIPLITATSETRNFVVHAVVPSLPGFGFSDGATKPGLGEAEIAVVLRNFMHAIGYEKFYIQGGDYGAVIANNMVTLYPKEILGYHTNFAVSLSPATIGTWIIGSMNDALQALVTDSSLAERLYPILSIVKYLISELGYMHTLATKPDTLGVAMSDSPTGLLAYMLQSMSSGSRKAFISRVDGGLDDLYSRDALIDNLMFYWTGNKFTTATRLYAESINNRTISMGISGISSPVPTRTMHAKDEIIYQSPAMLEFKFSNLLNSTVLSSCGHFLALENPEVYTQDVLESLVQFREWHANQTKTCKDEL